MHYISVSIAPDAPPTNITTSAMALGEILLSWLPPPFDQTNGIIVSYGIRYRNINSSNNESSLNVSSGARDVSTNTCTCTCLPLYIHVFYAIIIAPFPL